MGIDSKELFDICEQLPEIERAEVADFARFLLSKHDDAAWERTTADPKPRPRLDAFVRAALAEGSEPLDPESIGQKQP